MIKAYPLIDILRLQLFHFECPASQEFGNPVNPRILLSEEFALVISPDGKEDYTMVEKRGNR